MSPTAVVEQLIAACSRCDRAAVTALLADDVVCVGGPLEPARGKTATMALLEPFLTADAADWQVVAIASNGNTVFTERIDRFRFAGKGWVAIPAAGVFEVGADGRIAAWRDYFDLGELQRAMA